MASALGLDGPFAAWREKTPWTGVDPENPDDALWLAATDASRPVDPLIRPAPGPLLERTLYSAIEVWTEADLSAMHALWWIARRRQAPALRERALHAASWHIEHIQPDNATNRPWASHVFLDLWRTAGLVEARLHAETLLHNAEAGAVDARGTPGALIAAIVADSADALDLMLQD